jgi:hypothetical protein
MDRKLGKIPGNGLPSGVLRAVFIALLDVQEQTFGGNMGQHLHSFRKGRVKLPYGPIIRDVVGQLAFSLILVLQVVTGNDFFLFSCRLFHPDLVVFF